MRVYLSPLAEKKLIHLINYLVQEWGENSKKKFLKKLLYKVEQISLFPKSCPNSELLIGLHKCVVSKQTSFYYRIKEDFNEIEIITFFDNRQHPDNLLSEVGLLS